MPSTDIIRAYHAHVYFDADTAATAREVVAAAADAFDIDVGRMHERPVGPHPMWSCQLACSPDVFAGLLPWLALNRRGLIVFCHPETGDVVADHEDRGIWLGAGLALNMDVIRRAAGQG